VTPVPLDLPLRPSEAGELANLIFDHAERRPLSDDVRNRLAGRAAVLKLETITPYFGSLERDPVHPSAYYLVVDGIGGSSYLLYLALAAAPTSSIFHKALLIGRMRRVNGPEVVINATPFGSFDRQNIEWFASRIETAFLPRPQGSRTEIVVRGDAVAAFEVFRATNKRSGKNVAALAGDNHAGIWAAIRAGWRRGWTSIAELPAGSTSETIRAHAACSRFVVNVSGLERGEPALKAAEQVHERIRQARAALKISGAFEFEVALPAASAADLESCLEWLKARGHAAQLVSPAEVMGDLEDAAAVVRQQHATLSLRYGGEGDAWIATAAKATLGRVSIWVRNSEEAALVAESLMP